jgi:uncharacterized protein
MYCIRCLGLILQILAIMISEIFIYFGQIGAAAIIYAISLLAIVITSARSVDRKFLAILFIPIFKLVGMATPIFFQNALYSYALSCSIMFIPIYTIIKSRKFRSIEIGLVTKGMIWYSPIAVALGIILGLIEFQILRPDMFTLDHGFYRLLGLSLIIIAIGGFVEEFIFRSMLQTVLEKEFGNTKGLLAASLVFGLMFSIYGILSEIIFGFCAGLAIGYLFQRTRSLLLIALAHGIANITLFIIANKI